ncbi:MAG: iron-sulfur cluster assembly scaffold protein [Candidatus Kuenenbacteria bacterium]
MYTKKVLQCFKNPHNYGKIKNPDGIGKVGNIICGDVMWLYIKIDKKEIIKDIKFETFGCVAAIATSSIITDLAKGKTIEKALKITKKNIVNSLDGLPPIKLHCSVLAIDALSEAIYDYLIKNKKEIPKELQERHKRIEQEKKIIKKKYKDWIETEEEMHQKNSKCKIKNAKYKKIL